MGWLLADPYLLRFFEELEDIEWELRTWDDFKHYDSSLYLSILKNTTLEDFGLFTWSFKQLYIFLIFIGEVDSVKEQIIKFQGGPASEAGGDVIKLFRVYCDFVELLRKSWKHPTLENYY